MIQDTQHQEQVYRCQECAQLHRESTIGIRRARDHDGRVISATPYCGPVGCGSTELRLCTLADAENKDR